MRRMIMIAMAVGVLWIGADGLFAAATESATTTQPAVATLRPILSDEAKRDAAVEKIERFIKHASSYADATPTAREQIVTMWSEHKDDEDVEDFLLAGVAILSSDFAKGLSALDDGEYRTADAALAEAMKSSNPYVAMNAHALAARSKVEQDLLEEAESLLTPLAAREAELIEHTFLETEVDFLRGYAQLSNLHYDEAFESLDTFELQHPDAPERFSLPARQMLQELAVREAESLGEVSDLMVYSGRRLSNGYPGKPVQIKQDRAVELLSKLIAQAEERENQSKKGCKSCQGKGCKKCGGGGPPSGNNPSNSPANQSSLPDGPGRIGDLERSRFAKPGEVWGEMRPEEREKILQSLRERFPSQYRQLIEQYYKQLAKEN